MKFSNKNMNAISVVKLLLVCLITTFTVHASPEKDELSARQKAIIPIAALTASGNVTKLEKALVNGLKQGLSINEIKEIFIHSYAYAGFPRALNGINTFIKVMENRQKAGIVDIIGREAKPQPTDFDVNAYGHKVRNELVGRDISNRKTGYAPFVPTIDKFLVEHLFADIFYRDVLSIKDRELVTISILSALPGAEAQLTSHMKLSLRVGYTPAQLLSFITVLNNTVAQDNAIRALKIMESVSPTTDVNTNVAKVKVNRDQSYTLGSKDKFVGEAKITSRFASPVPSHYRGAMVEFESGARTAWHTHPKGQTLIIISGKGLVQSEGSEIQTMLPGDVITIPPNTRHWHGAALDSPMSHIAISTPDNGKTVEWMELVDKKDKTVNP